MDITLRKSVKQSYFMKLRLVIIAKFSSRRSGRRYELVSVLSPTKYLQCAGLGSAQGWTGEPASDIPASLFPKHVQVYWGYLGASYSPYFHILRGCILVATWPLLGSLSSSNSTIMITTEVARILKVFQMLWEEVKINHC